MPLAVRWLAALAAAFIASALVLVLLVGTVSMAGGNEDMAFVFGMSLGAFAGVLVGTVKAPTRHRKWALWVFVVLVCLVPGAWLAQALAQGGTVAPELWQQAVGSLAGALLARIVARASLRGFGEVFFYTASPMDGWQASPDANVVPFPAQLSGRPTSQPLLPAA